MPDADWDWRYVRAGKKRKKTTPQQRALRARHKAGLRMATPQETRSRVEAIAQLMRDNMWYGGASVVQLASDWNLSVSRVEQLAAEARRMVTRG